MSRLPRLVPPCPWRRLRLALPLALAALALAAMPALGPRPPAPGSGSAATETQAGRIVAHTERPGLPLRAEPDGGAMPPYLLPAAEAAAPDGFDPAGPEDRTGIFLAGVAEGGSADLPAALSGTGGGGAPASARIGGAPAAPGGHRGGAGAGGGDAGGGAGGGGGVGGVGGGAPGGGTPSVGGDAPLLFTANQPIPLPPGGIPPARFDPPGRPPAGGVPPGEPPRGGETPEVPPRPPEIPPPAPTAAPEPGALMLLALPLVAIAILRWSARRPRRDALVSKPG